MICFRVTLNGDRLVTAGIPGHSVLAANVTWVHRMPNPNRTTPDKELTLHVGGLDSDGAPKGRVHLDWVNRALSSGDVVELRVLESNSPDAPATRRVWPQDEGSKRQRLSEYRERRKDLDVAIARLERGITKERKPRKRKRRLSGGSG